jgi:hypothetical protein
MDSGQPVRLPLPTFLLGRTSNGGIAVLPTTALWSKCGLLPHKGKRAMLTTDQINDLPSTVWGRALAHSQDRTASAHELGRPSRSIWMRRRRCPRHGPASANWILSNPPLPNYKRRTPAPARPSSSNVSGPSAMTAATPSCVTTSTRCARSRSQVRLHAHGARGRRTLRGGLRPLWRSALRGHSRMSYLEFAHSQCFETFVRCHIHVFAAFNGVSREIFYDNRPRPGPNRMAAWSASIRVSWHSPANITSSRAPATRLAGGKKKKCNAVASDMAAIAESRRVRSRRPSGAASSTRCPTARSIPRSPMRSGRATPRSKRRPWTGAASNQKTMRGSLARRSTRRRGRCGNTARHAGK